MILLKKLLIPLILFVLIFFALFAYTLVYYSKNLPNIEEIIKYKPKTITKIYDRNDLLYGLFFDEKREYRKIDKLLRHSEISHVFAYVFSASVSSAAKCFHAEGPRSSTATPTLLQTCTKWTYRPSSPPNT